MADKKIQWHPRFAAAMDLELSANRKNLVYEREYNLNTKPLEIDLLVIKKEPAEDITVSIVRERKPEGLFRYFEAIESG